MSSDPWPARGELLVHGYTRKFAIVPSDLSLMIWSFCRIISVRFSATYCSDTHLTLLQNGTKVVKDDSSRFIYTFADQQPASHGIHCWRVFIHNLGQQDHIFWGIAKLQRFVEVTASSKTCWGQISNGWSRRDGKYETCDGFRVRPKTRKYCVDMLLDCDKGTLDMGVMDKDIVVDANQTTHCLHGIPQEETLMHGWVPVFILYASKISIQLKQIGHSSFLLPDAGIDAQFNDRDN